MSLTRQRSVSNRQEAPQIVLPKGKDAAIDAPFEPCAATAAHFLFAQGSTILVLHHDSLQLERRFQSHTEPIKLISVDNVSERGQGRLVVTYDAGKTAIIWDLFTGEQVSRFASYEPLLVAAWMRNGNIAFGNEKGDVILFEPATSEHISARTIFDPITALAPSSDCKTYAIGYHNGSILLAALQPQFTILHTLNTSRSPSPISMLTWHASSSKQKSDMLAIQNADGDLRIWSVSKPPTAGQPRVIRILKRNDTFVHGRNWMSWSRNGRVIQFTEGETWAWDVRTKDVNYYPVPTIEYVKGIAAHGPTASLFTLGPDYTVQQYDVDTVQMVANIRHTPVTIPPTPPQDYAGQFRLIDEDETTSPLKAGRYEPENQKHRSETPASTHSHTQSAGSKKSADKRQANNGDITTPATAKTEKTTTTFSVGAYNYSYPQLQSAQPISPSSGSSRLPNPKKGSRLRQEIVMSPATPADASVVDLFPFARARLSEVQQQPNIQNEGSMTTDEQRRHMLSVVFGWEDDIYALIEDELSRHPVESLDALFLTKWLDGSSETVGEIMGCTPADPAVDWVRLALGVLDNRPESKKISQIFVEKMLVKGEIHMAVAALLALGDKNDAIEVYVSNHCYLEAILLTCLLMPQDWQRQSHLVRKWGEHVVENSQQHLAIRCFACTGAEPSDSWLSPTAQMYSKMTSPMGAIQTQPLPPPQQQQQQQQYKPPQQVQPAQPAPILQQVQQPQSGPAINFHMSRLKGRGFEAPTPVALIAPPTPFRTAAAFGTRITPQTGGLKLITSFGQKAQSFKFPGLKTDDMTPINATNITPIAESAIDRSALSPGGLGSYKLNNIASLNSAMSATSRSRLPSIGETPLDVESPSKFPSRNAPRGPPTPADSSSDKEKEKLAAAKAEAAKQESRKEKQEPLTLLTSAKYTPSSTPVQNYNSDPEPQTALRPSTSNSWHNSLNRVQEESSHSRTGSHGRNHAGLSLKMLDGSNPIQRPTTTDSTNTNFVLSPPNTGDSSRVKSPSVSGRSIDQYISSLEQAQIYGRTRSRNSSRAPKEEKSERKRSKHRKHKASEDASSRDMVMGKRSPSSPVPMSPEEFQNYRHGSLESFDTIYNSHDASANEYAPASSKPTRREPASTAGTGKVRHRSRSAQAKHGRSARGRDAEQPEHGKRGRSKSRNDDSAARSPSSPLPMLPSEDDVVEGTSGDPAFKFVSKNRSRLNRSTSRRPERGTSVPRTASPDRRTGRARSSGRQQAYESSIDKGRRKRQESSEEDREEERLHSDTIEKLEAMADSIRNNTSTARLTTHSKELAQAELEARRLSLARRPSAPSIPMPGHGNFHSKSASDGLTMAPPPLTRNHTDSVLRPVQFSNRHITAESRGRPGTPQAMLVPSEDTEQEAGIQLLGNGAYQLPPRTYSANAMREDLEIWRANDVPDGMPRHPAFDHRVGTGRSRGSSRSRTRGNSPERRRGRSTERSRLPQMSVDDQPAPMIVGDYNIMDASGQRISMGPAVIPELQHLAIPPPPPPPPAPPKDLRVHTDLSNIASIPLPRSAYVGDHEPSSATPDKFHKRIPSRNESGQFIGKIKGITERMRSSSKPRDNYSRSPNLEDDIMSPYETVTMMPPPLTSVTERGYVQ